METLTTNKQVEILFMSDEEYDKLPQLRTTGLKNWVFGAGYAMAQTFEKKEAMRLGSAYHALLNSIEFFNEQYYVYDDSAVLEYITKEYYDKYEVEAKNKDKLVLDYDIWIIDGLKNKKPKSVKRYTDFMEEQERLSGGKELLSISDYNTICGMRDKLKTNPLIENWLTTPNGYSESVWFGKLEGEEVKIKVDRLIINEKHKTVTIVDWKKMGKTPIPNSCVYQLQDFDYPTQAATYTDIIKQNFPDYSVYFFFVFQEPEGSYEYLIVEADEDINKHEYPIITTGRKLYQLALSNMKKYKESGNIHLNDIAHMYGGEHGIVSLGLTPWYVDKFNFSESW